MLGISPDTVKAVGRFDEKHSLGFTLLADEDHAVAEKYGTWVEKSMYGKKYMGVQRATFIVDADGKVAHVIEKAKPKTHDDEVLAALRATQLTRPSPEAKPRRRAERHIQLVET